MTDYNTTHRAIPAAEPTPLHTALRVIGVEHTVPEILPGSLLASRGERVWATGSLIAMLEDVTWEVIAPHVPDERALVGCGGVYEHTAPTLPGQQVRIEVYRTHVPDGDGKQRWTARAVNVDTGQQVGVLHHEVATPNRERFYRRCGRGREETAGDPQ
ncbi:hypothetical protein REH65_31015 [Saccharopolyspora sp. ID03-671]|uniref:thioesterase, FlK family n=1 Tax=Saccharopolyspora sp. ID03-671 TaxID=3073066 RepID=UPI00324E87E2